MGISEVCQPRHSVNPPELKTLPSVDKMMQFKRVNEICIIEQESGKELNSWTS